MKSTLKVLLPVLLTAAIAGPMGALLSTRASTSGEARSPAPHTCPMHPSVVQDGPGLCPICNMKLIAAQPVVATSAAWVCPMHPAVVQDHPGLCPLCNMKLVQRAVEPTPHQEVDELAVISVEPTRQQLLGLRTATVDRGALGSTLVVPAKVAVDETLVRRVSLKVPGYVERLFVDFLGKPVRRGQPLFALHSPEVMAAEQEWLAAHRAGNAALAAALRHRLELWDIPSSELERLEREGQAARTVTFLAPVSGVVTKKEVVEGARLEAGSMPFEVTDLSQVWVVAQLHESDLRFVKVGQGATLSLVAWPGRSFPGVVRFIEPQVDAASRAVRVRLSFANTEGLLRPELFGEVAFAREATPVVRVPVDAVIRGGQHDVAFVARADGHFEPRQVTLGEVSASYAEVLDGLEVGEAVVTRANFFIESESRLRASVAKFAQAPKASRPSAAAEP